MRDELDDPWERNGGVVAVRSEFDRPARVEDMVPVHRNPKDGRPRIWLPDGTTAKYYSRPSSWGKKVEDSTMLSKWTTRVTVDGFLDFGDQSEALQMEHAALGPSEADQGSKQQHNELNDKAKGLSSQADRVGTALHAITERWDLGLEVHPPRKFQADLEAWKRGTDCFTIVDMPDGRPGVECFVAFDMLRPGAEFDGSHWTHWVRLAGTFDRLWRYKPCDVEDENGKKCGRRVYVGDLKSGKADSLKWAEASIAVQLAIYAHAKQYVPNPDGKGAIRFDMPDICPHRAITFSLPAGTGQARVIWTNIVGGLEVAIDLVPRLTAHRRRKDWFADFTPVLDPWTAIDRCQTVDDLVAMWRQFPDKALWAADDNALLRYATARKQLLTTGVIG